MRTNQFHFLPGIRSGVALSLTLSCQSLQSGYFGDVVVVAPLTESPPLINGEIAFRLGDAGRQDLVAFLGNGEGRVKGTL